MMTIAINPQQLPVMRPEGVSAPANVRETSGSSFGEALSDFVKEVDQTQRVAEQQSTNFAEGRSNDIHGTMIALQRADVSLRLLGSVRNRALEAYREIMRMGA